MTDQKDKTINILYDLFYDTVKGVKSESGKEVIKGLLQKIISISIVEFLSKEPVRVTTSTLPKGFIEGSKLVFVELEIESDVDISSWKPLGVSDNGIIQLKKKSGEGRIKYVDGKTLRYNFVEKVGGFITLIYSEIDNKFIVY